MPEARKRASFVAYKIILKFQNEKRKIKDEMILKTSLSVIFQVHCLQSLCYGLLFIISLVFFYLGKLCFGETDFSDVFLFSHKQHTIVPFLSKLINSQ